MTIMSSRDITAMTALTGQKRTGAWRYQDIIIIRCITSRVCCQDFSSTVMVKPLSVISDMCRDNGVQL